MSWLLSLAKSFASGLTSAPIQAIDGVAALAALVPAVTYLFIHPDAPERIMQAPLLTLTYGDVIIIVGLLWIVSRLLRSGRGN